MTLPDDFYERFETAFVNEVASERRAQFAQGDLLVSTLATVEPHWPKGSISYTAIQRHLFKRAAHFALCSPKTIAGRYRVCVVFPEDKRAQDMSFEIHRLCAYQKDPEQWLDNAAHYGWNCQQLREAITAAGGDALAGMPRRIVDRRQAYVARFNSHEITLVFDEALGVDSKDFDGKFIVSIVAVTGEPVGLLTSLEAE